MAGSHAARTLGVTATAAALALGGFAGTAAVAADDNGVVNLDPEQILRRSAAAFKAADSVHIEIKDDGARTGVEEADLSVDRQGNCTGDMKLPDDGGGFAFMVQADRTTWIKPDDNMLENLTSDSGGPSSPSSETDELEGKWIERDLDGSEGLEGLKILCNLDTLQTLATTQLTDPVKGERSEIDDTKVIAVTGMANGQEHTLYVAAEGKPYPVGSESADGELSAALSDFGELVTVMPPPAGEVTTL
ncbi:hypothetical protein [Streptomyces sp. KLOTTS4A1]|uniref:hypothetical protein n=1 Tax=Streptomyces sp. KLOTTS4A1 TaxID=3390996 RepID=UPI0039F45B76